MLLMVNQRFIHPGKIQSFVNSKTFLVFILVFVFLSLTNCTNDHDDKLFRLRESSRTGLTFNNTITISDSLNAVTFEYIYNGGGAAVGDVNNDGKKDLFFSGNMVSSRLYLNEGNLKFEDVTDQAGVKTDSWCTGASFVDINNDGWLDLYVCVAGLVKPEHRRNIFFINKGIDENGVPHFVDQAGEMGLDDDGYSTMAVFFDYDKDLDLDMYLLTNSMKGEQRNMIKPIQVMGESETTDRLYRNIGDHTFINWSKEAGILKEGFGLGIGLCDINQDNWIDVYCANDFISSDLLWINNQDGTFSECAGEYFKHFTNNGMGMDIADYNNDALIDFIVLDMMPVTNLRQKLMLGFRSTERFNSSLEMGYLPQFLRNTLQLNMGKFPDGKFKFSEIGLLAGIFQTDWSWAPLFTDFDNDGWKDLLITNGYRKDVTNLDYINEIIRETRFGSDEEKKMILLNAMDKLDDVKLSNYLFKNKRDLTFEDISEKWGLDVPTFTNGTITADLDNDGDIDIVVNNMDQEVYLFENQLNMKRPQHHFLRLVFSPDLPHHDRIGTKIWIFQKENHQYFEYSPYRGYKSTIDQEINIGLGKNRHVDSLIVQWPDGSVNRHNDIQGDTLFSLGKKESSFSSAGSYIEQFDVIEEKILFSDITDSIKLTIKHEETTHDDLKSTPILLRNLSKYGPSISVGNINDDGLDDIFVSGDRHKKGIILQQNKQNEFYETDQLIDSTYEDLGSLFFDADNDGDDDLYVVSGGSFWPASSSYYQDRLYLNDGNGVFRLGTNNLPEIQSSGSCVIAADYDSDGDLDLFVGGRLSPNLYPTPPKSYLLENQEGIFIDRSELLGSEEGRLGMVTSALWTDINNDDASDLLIVGEWMRITALINQKHRFVNQTQKYELTNSSGWWNSVNGGDIDNDGDIDYVVGNYGLNSFYKASPEYPLEIYGKDFDRNGTFDPIVTNYIDGVAYIVHSRNTIIRQIPSIEYRFLTYEAYGATPFKNSLTTEELSGAVHLDCKNMQSVVLENVNGEYFNIHELPIEVQFSPVFGTTLEDFNNDNRLDIMLIGNSMADETFAGYYDASFGNVLINQGEFQWKVLQPSKTRLIVDGDKKALAKLNINNQETFLMSENNGYLKTYTFNNQQKKSFKSARDDFYFILKHNNLSRKIELYNGSGFLSSSSRTIWLPDEVSELNIFGFTGKSRDVTLNND